MTPNNMITNYVSLSKTHRLTCSQMLWSTKKYPDTHTQPVVSYSGSPLYNRKKYIVNISQTYVQMKTKAPRS